MQIRDQISAEEESGQEQKDERVLTTDTSKIHSRTKSTTWGSLWTRYKNVWRANIRYNNIGVKVGVMGLIGLLIAGILVSSPFTAVLIAHIGALFCGIWAAKGKLSRFMGAHLGIVIALPLLFVIGASVIQDPSIGSIGHGIILGSLLVLMHSLMYLMYAELGIKWRDGQLLS